MSKAKAGRKVQCRVECVTCKRRTTIEIDSIEPNDVPYCEHCFSPMIVLGVTVELVERRKRRGKG